MANHTFLMTLDFCTPALIFFFSIEKAMNSAVFFIMSHDLKTTREMILKCIFP